MQETAAPGRRQTRRCFLGVFGVGRLGIALLSVCGTGQGPAGTANAQLFYNRNMVPAAGLDVEKSPPKAWAELTDPSKQQWGLGLGPQVTQGNKGTMPFPSSTARSPWNWTNRSSKR